MDKILIRDLEIYAYHGVNPEEKENGQRFVLDITAQADLSSACRSDRLEDTVSYARIIKTAVAAFTAEKYDLLERAAAVVCDAILEAYPRIAAVEITLKKPDAPIRADFGWVGVCIRRQRDE